MATLFDMANELRHLEVSLEQNVHRLLEVYGKKIVDRASSTHRYNNRTGDLSNAQYYDIRTTKTEKILQLFLANPNSKAFNYASIIHNGSRKWSPDKFLEDAILYYLPMLEKELSELDK